MTLEQANNEYIESIKTRIHDHYFVLGDDVRVVAIKKSIASSIYGIYLAFEDEDTFRLVCTDGGVDLFLAIEDSVVDCKDAMWATLVEDAKRHGFTETTVNLSNVPDEFLIDELKRRGRLL